MNCELERNQRINGKLQTKVAKLESQVEAIRARLSKERDILGKHETTLSRKDERGEEPGITQARVDNKRELIANLEERKVELEYLAQLMRGQIDSLLNFNPVQASIDNLPSRFRQAKNGEWRIVNSRFKTFQDIFTPHEARILPDYKRKPSRSEFERLPIDACPVDPARIPDWFVEEFDLGSLEGLSDFEKLERKAEFTPKIRELFTHLQPLKANKRKTHRVMVLEDYDPKHDGKILSASYLGHEEKEKDRKTMKVYGSVYEAHRAMLYADEGYDHEQEKLHGIKSRTQGLLQEIKGMKKDDLNRGKVVKDIGYELSILGHVLNHYKAEASDILEEVKSLRDASGRHNPGATCARMVKVVGLLEKRLPQLFEKSRWVSDDKKILNKTIHNGAGVLEAARISSLNLCQALENSTEESEIVRRLELMPKLEELKVRPFNKYAAKIQEKTAEIKAALATGDKKAVRDAAINAYVVCKVFEVQHERERMLRDIAASPMETSIESLLKRAGKLQEVARSKETFPKVRTGQNESYNEMANMVDLLVKGLNTYSKRDLKESERLAMYERLKKYLEEIDFTEVLEKL